MSDEIKVQSKNKNTKLVIAAAAVVIAVLTVVAIILVGSNSATAKQVKEQLSLGEKYLSELQYEQAIAAYELAIEIDPKCEEAYLALAEIYIENGEFEKVEEILDKAEEALGEETEGIEELREKIKKREGNASPDVQEPTESAAQTPNGTPAPDAPKMVKGTFKLQTTSDGVEVESENFKVTQNDATGEIKITLSGVSIQDTYITNKSSAGKNYLEYGWHVEAAAENYKYEVSVSSWASDPGQEMSRKVSEMQHSIWEYNAEERSWSSIGWTAVEYTSESLTWIFTMPEGYTLDIRKIQEYEIGITADCQTTEIRRYTPATEGTMTPTPALKPSPTPVPTASPLPSPTPLPTATPRPAKRISSNDIYVGATITYGYYEQDTDLENGAEPIEWVVLDIRDGKALMISKVVLDYQKYHEKSSLTSWKICSLRQWLNTTFLQKAFSETEQEYIHLSEIEDESGSTEDKVFLLSLSETEKYFNLPDERMTSASKYAVDLGAMVSTKSGYEGCTEWWLRDVEYGQQVEYIRPYTLTASRSAGGATGVRPAMWVDIKQEEPMELTELFSSANIHIGKGVRFGSYEQDNVTENGLEQIEWIVTDVQDGKALLVSRLGLDAKPYHTSREEVTWENCYLREWLNSDFYESAFTNEEQEYIIASSLKNVIETNYWKYKGEGGNVTSDKVFLLSIDEVLQYDLYRPTKPTEYALNQGAYLSWFYGIANCIWWARSSVYRPNIYFSSPKYLHAAYFLRSDYPHAQYADGYELIYEEGEVYQLPCIRPAIWVKVSP